MILVFRKNSWEYALINMCIKHFSRVCDKGTMKTAYLLTLAVFVGFFSMGDSLGIGE